MEFARAEAGRRGLPLALAAGVMSDLPYDDGRFDFVLAWNVIYHGNGDVVRRCVSEIRRVLRPGGVYQGTMLSTRHRAFGRGREVAPNTFVLAGEGDKAHPHFYCDARELVGLFSGFELRSLVDREQRDAGTYHWHLVAKRQR